MRESMLKIKVCGMRDSKNIMEVSRYTPDFIGFIFYKDSPRYVGKDFQVPESLAPSIKRVGVFVNELLENILALVEKHDLHFVQLHGDESPELCEELRESGAGVIKAFGVEDHASFPVTTGYIDFVDYFLFDAKGELRGGNGVSFDWKILKNYKGKIPFFLSGGIDASSIEAVKEQKEFNIYAVDVNSKIELSPGIKDIRKMNELVNALSDGYEI